MSLGRPDSANGNGGVFPPHGAALLWGHAHVKPGTTAKGWPGSSGATPQAHHTAAAAAAAAGTTTTPTGSRPQPALPARGKLKDIAREPGAGVRGRAAIAQEFRNALHRGAGSAAAALPRDAARQQGGAAGPTAAAAAATTTHTHPAPAPHPEGVGALSNVRDFDFDTFMAGIQKGQKSAADAGLGYTTTTHSHATPFPGAPPRQGRAGVGAGGSSNPAQQPRRSMSASTTAARRAVMRALVGQGRGKGGGSSSTAAGMPYGTAAPGGGGGVRRPDTTTDEGSHSWDTHPRSTAASTHHTHHQHPPPGGVGGSQAQTPPSVGSPDPSTSCSSSRVGGGGGRFRYATAAAAPEARQRRGGGAGGGVGGGSPFACPTSPSSCAPSPCGSAASAPRPLRVGLSPARAVSVAVDEDEDEVSFAYPEPFYGAGVEDGEDSPAGGGGGGGGYASAGDVLDSGVMPQGGGRHGGGSRCSTPRSVLSLGGGVPPLRSADAFAQGAADVSALASVVDGGGTALDHSLDGSGHGSSPPHHTSSGEAGYPTASPHGPPCHGGAAAGMQSPDDAEAEGAGVEGVEELFAFAPQHHHRRRGGGGGGVSRAAVSSQPAEGFQFAAPALRPADGFLDDGVEEAGCASSWGNPEEEEGWEGGGGAEPSGMVCVAVAAELPPPALDLTPGQQRLLAVLRGAQVRAKLRGKGRIYTEQIHDIARLVAEGEGQREADLPPFLRPSVLAVNAASLKAQLAGYLQGDAQELWQPKPGGRPGKAGAGQGGRAAPKRAPPAPETRRVPPPVDAPVPNDSEFAASPHGAKNPFDASLKKNPFDEVPVGGGGGGGGGGAAVLITASPPRARSAGPPRGVPGQRRRQQQQRPKSQEGGEGAEAAAAAEEEAVAGGGAEDAGSKRARPFLRKGARMQRTYTPSRGGGAGRQGGSAGVAEGSVPQVQSPVKQEGGAGLRGAQPKGGVAVPQRGAGGDQRQQQQQHAVGVATAVPVNGRPVGDDHPRAPVPAAAAASSTSAGARLAQRQQREREVVAQRLSDNVTKLLDTWLPQSAPSMETYFPGTLSRQDQHTKIVRLRPESNIFATFDPGFYHTIKASLT